MAFSKQEYLDYTLKTIKPRKMDSILEVAAGTCVCGRSFAPQVRSVTCLDATEAMLLAGKEVADRNQLDNMMFIKGCVEELPFLDDSFDIVFSRLAFHHFACLGQYWAYMQKTIKIFAHNKRNSYLCTAFKRNAPVHTWKEVWVSG